MSIDRGVRSGSSEREEGVPQVPHLRPSGRFPGARRTARGIMRSRSELLPAAPLDRSARPSGSSGNFRRTEPPVGSVSVGRPARGVPANVRFTGIPVFLTSTAEISCDRDDARPPTRGAAGWQIGPRITRGSRARRPRDGLHVRRAASPDRSWPCAHVPGKGCRPGSWPAEWRSRERRRRNPFAAPPLPAAEPAPCQRGPGGSRAAFGDRQGGVDEDARSPPGQGSSGTPRVEGDLGDRSGTHRHGSSRQRGRGLTRNRGAPRPCHEAIGFRCSSFTGNSPVGFSRALRAGSPASQFGRVCGVRPGPPSLRGGVDRLRINTSSLPNSSLRNGLI